VIVGLASGVLWVAQVNARFSFSCVQLFNSVATLSSYTQSTFLTLNSTVKSRGRNTTFFWVIFQSSGVCGNLFVFLAMFKYKLNLDYMFLVLAILGALGTFCLLFLRKPIDLDSHANESIVATSPTINDDAENSNNTDTTSNDETMSKTGEDSAPKEV
jgi:hypothetical protein